MTNRHTANSINDEALDALYAQRDGLNRLYINAMAELGIAVNRLDRVRALAERWRYTGDRKDTARPELLTALDGPAPAATEATGPFIDRPFRSHRPKPETEPAHACTYGERCPNCRD